LTDLVCLGVGFAGVRCRLGLLYLGLAA